MASLRLAFAAGCLLAVPASAAQPLALPPGAATAAEQITPAALTGPVRFLADDLLAGRGPASHGDSLARAYIASEFASLGLEPGMPGGAWQQPFEIVGITAQLPSVWGFESAGGRRLDLAHWNDWIASAGSQTDSARLDGAEIVFVGFGIQAPEYDWDDFAAADLRGKVLLFLNNDPDWDPKLFAGKTRLYYGRWDYKYEVAARLGAAGAIIVHTTPSAGYPWTVVQSSWSGEQYELPSPAGPHLQVRGWVTEDAARRLAGLAGRDLDRLVTAAKKRGFRPVPLGVTTRFGFANARSRKTTANVLGLLRGSDPALASEAVVFTAHHDHLGVGEPDSTGDAIYNGALDNASGVAQILAIARAFRALGRPPRRSVLFLAVGTEEAGLLGSEWYCRHPTFPPGKIAADLNFDGMNIWGATHDIAVVGKGKSSLDTLAEAAAALQGRVVVAEHFPDRGHFYRSDQFNFARIGVPSLYFDNGLDFVGRQPGWGRAQVEAWEARHYHRPSDELDGTWNLEGAVLDARLGFLCGLGIAEADALPRWLPGDEFEAARRQALSATGQ